MKYEKIQSGRYLLIHFFEQYGFTAIRNLSESLRLKRKYHFGCKEYLYVDYPNLSRTQKESLLFLKDYLNMCFRINPFANLAVLRDKGTVIERLPQYLGRACFDTRKHSEEELSEFLQTHIDIYAKKNFSPAGIGMRVFRDLSTPAKVYSALRQCQNEKLEIIEAFIKQHPLLNTLYSEAISTIRIHTLRTKAGIEVVFAPEITIPVDGERDSIHSDKGKYIIEIDVNNGQLGEVADFVKERLTDFTSEERVHRNTKIPFAEITIPKWGEVLDMVKTAAQAIPELSYIGWDVAISERGPVIIEGNAISGELIAYQIRKFQRNHNHGIKPLVQEIFNQAVPSGGDIYD